MKNKVPKEPQQYINKPLKLNSVPKSENPSDNILVQGADKTVKFITKDELNKDLQVNTDWNSESGFSQLLNKPDFKTINGESLLGNGDIIIEKGLQNLDQILAQGNSSFDNSINMKGTGSSYYTAIYNSGFLARNNNGLNTGAYQADFLNISSPAQDTSIELTSERTTYGDLSTVRRGVLDTSELRDAPPFTYVTLKYPFNKASGTYTLATLDDISGGENQDLKSVLENGSVAEFADGKRGIYSFNEDSDTFETYTENNFGMWTDLEVSSNYLRLSSGNTNFADKQSSISVAPASEDLDTAKINFNLMNGGFQTTVDFDTNLTANTTLKFPAPTVEGNYTIATTKNIEDAVSGPIARIIPYGEVLVFKTSPEGNPKIKESGDFCLGYIDGVFISGAYTGNNSYDIKSELEL